MKNKFIYLIVCTAILLAACGPGKTKSNGEERFQVIHPLVADTIYKQEYVADIQVVQNVELRSRVKGFLDKIHVDEGSLVKEGQTLFSISNLEYKEALLKAKAQLKTAIAEAKMTELQLQNVKTLFDKNIVSKAELELAQAKLEARLAQVEEARSNESAASLNLSFTDIKAPFSGVINRILNKTGSLIAEGTLLTTISDNKQVFAYFNVSEKEYLEIVKEKEVNHQKEVILILADNQPYPYRGRIETLESEIDKSTGNHAFRARFDNPEQLLKHGASGKIQVTKKLKNVLLIPQKSTFEIQEKIYVYVVDTDNRVSMKNVVPEFRLPHLYVIESGLKPSDRIIYEGIQQIKEGVKIIPELISSKKMVVDQAK